MKVKMLSRLAGPDRILNPGDVADLPRDFAQELIRGKYAESAEPAVKTNPVHVGRPKAENAMADAPEAAVADPVPNAAAQPATETRRGRRGKNA